MTEVFHNPRLNRMLRIRFSDLDGERILDGETITIDALAYGHEWDALTRAEVIDMYKTWISLGHRMIPLVPPGPAPAPIKVDDQHPNISKEA